MVYLIIFLFLVVCGGLATLTVFNVTTQVHLSALSWQSPDLPVGIWLLMAFFLGALLLYLISVAEAASDRRELKRLRVRIADLEQQQDTADAKGSSVPSIPMQSNPTIPRPALRPSGPLMPMPGAPQPGAGASRQQDLPPQQFRQ